MRDAAEKEETRLRIVRFMLSHPLATRGLHTHGSTAITTSRHHLYLRDTAKPCPGRIVTVQGPYSRRLGLIGPSRYLASSFRSSRVGPDGSRDPALKHQTKEKDAGTGALYRSRLIGFKARERFCGRRPSRNSRNWVEILGRSKNRIAK